MFKRKRLDEIKKYLTTGDIIVIHGARQTGKTTILKMIQKQLPEKNNHYIDLEDSRFIELCNSGINNLIDYLKQKGVLKNQKRFFLLIDEIQYLDNPSSFLKLIHDHFPFLKLIVSGSSSFDIKKKFKDSLVGRTVNFELFPLDFEEFLLFKKKTFNLNKKITSDILITELKSLYREYVIYGGYPKIVLTDSVEMKEKYLQQTIDTYIKKDIRDIGKIKHIDKFNKLLTTLASQSGQLLNISELSNTAQLARQTIEEYIFLLENTYIIKRVMPFSRNIRTELFKNPKIFFYDTGLMHMLWLKSLPGEVIGNAFETSIFSELVKNINSNNICFWRTQDKKEIDFIITLKNQNIPMEVKLNAAKLNYTSIKYFSKVYQPRAKLCICLEGKLPHEQFKITFINPWEYQLFL